MCGGRGRGAGLVGRGEGVGEGKGVGKGKGEQDLPGSLSSLLTQQHCHRPAHAVVSLPTLSLACPHCR